jgi:hypothetical protein
MTLIVVPAYGRDYTREDAVLAAWEGGADFENVTVGVRGRYVSCRSPLAEHGVTSVEIRYADLRELVIVPVEAAGG